MDHIRGKNIVVGVCGGIAAYKSCELVRSLVKRDAAVQVVMTRNAANFITPLTLQTLSGRKVALGQYDLEREDRISHIDIADNADLIVVAPATASFLGKLASGIADNLLLNVILAARARVILCPSMNVNMFSNPAVQENIRKLEVYGYTIIDPAEGYLACGWEGKGRLPEVYDIILEAERALHEHDFAGKKILVTSGATREYIDQARFLSNPSSGKMGYALCKAAWMRGAEVICISGHTTTGTLPGVKNIKTVSAEDMYRQVMKIAPDADIIIKTAAVSDYTPLKRSASKIKKESGNLNIEFTRTTDILAELGRKFSEKIVVGFAAECENILENSRKKIKSKNIDLIVSNDISEAGCGFESDTNRVTIIDKTGRNTEIPLLTKEEIAHRILDKIAHIRK